MFDNTWTQQGPATRVGGYPFASFMLGYATGGSIATLSKASNIMYYQGYYFADTFQVNRKLTLTMGLRWELPGFYTEKKDRDTVLDPTPPRSSGCQDRAASKGPTGSGELSWTSGQART